MCAPRVIAAAWRAASMLPPAPCSRRKASWWMIVWKRASGRSARGMRFDPVGFGQYRYFCLYNQEYFATLILGSTRRDDRSGQGARQRERQQNHRDREQAISPHVLVGHDPKHASGQERQHRYTVQTQASGAAVARVYAFRS